MPDRTPAVGMERKLAAIFSTDVAGYSRLMGEDEEATIRTLTAYREIISSLIQQHRGRVVDTPGDNLLAEFASVVDAVRCAVEIQDHLKTKNAELPAHRQMQFRIGINLGDVVVEGERLYGDGVNIAARLESVAIPGGICISGTVYDQIETKLSLQYDYQGEQTVKNIAKPVRVYRVAAEVPSPLAGEGQGEGASHGDRKFKVQSSKTHRVGNARRNRALVAGSSLLLLVGTILAVHYLPFSLLGTQYSELDTEKLRPPSLPLPDKPSIAVLPFTNLSGDPEQEYFSDGMTEDLITDLSKFSGLFVIARNSVFTYKGKAIDIEEVGQKFGVRYVLEGSTRKVDNRVRINAQLVDATTGGHLWAERYDRDFKDIFTLQDEITQEIIRSLRVEVQEAERDRVRRIPTNNLTAYDAWLRGVEYWWRVSNDDNLHARQLFEQAIQLDPQYAEAYAWLGWTYWLEWVWKVDSQLFERAGEYAQRALTLNDALPDAHVLLGHVYLWQKRQYDQAIAEGRRAIALDPNHAFAHVMLADILNNTGHPEEAVSLLRQGMRLDPRYSFYFPFQLGVAYTLLGQHNEAIAALQESLRLNPHNADAYFVLSWFYAWPWIGQWSQDPQMLERAEKAAQHAVALSDSVDWSHRGLSTVYLWRKEHEKASSEAERSIALNPTEGQNLTSLGTVLNFMGQPDTTLQKMKHVNCSTVFSAPTLCFSTLGDAYYLARRYQEAINAFQQALQHPPLWDQGLFALLGLAASYSELGQEDAAQAEIAAVLKINPQFSLEGVRQRWPYKDPEDLERFVTALRKAGLK